MVESLSGVVAGSGYSFWMTGLFASGVAGLLLVLVLLVSGGRYGGAPGLLSPAELREARREVEGRISELAPRVILLAGRLRTVDEALAGGDLEDGLWRRVERLSREAPAAGVWRRYSGASALARERPLAALEELREVEWMVETAVSKLEEAELLCNAGERL
ncbi:MAG: hypothetical protein M3N10_10780 [Actinomycetota bacterium]|nr:hypothetical protein [Actinomycetota bacterium]